MLYVIEYELGEVSTEEFDARYFYWEPDVRRKIMSAGSQKVAELQAAIEDEFAGVVPTDAEINDYAASLFKG